MDLKKLYKKIQVRAFLPLSSHGNFSCIKKNYNKRITYFSKSEPSRKLCRLYSIDLFLVFLHAV